MIKHVSIVEVKSRDETLHSILYISRSDTIKYTSALNQPEYSANL
jgi:hypothetical protein